MRALSSRRVQTDMLAVLIHVFEIQGYTYLATVRADQLDLGQH